MGLRDTLEKHKVPIPDDFDERLDIIIAGLKRKSNYKQKLEKFKQRHSGGAEPDPVAPAVVPDSEDYLGPRLRWFLTAVTSPYARTLLEGIFMVVFFVSYLEKIPVFGSILSASFAPLSIKGMNSPGRVCIMLNSSSSYSLRSLKSTST